MTDSTTGLGSEGSMNEGRLAAVLDFLRGRIGPVDLPGLLQRLRDGDPKASSEYANLTLRLTQPSTWAEWPGPERPDTICRTLNGLVERVRTANEASHLLPPPPTVPPLQSLSAPTTAPGISTIAEALCSALDAVPAPQALAEADKKDGHQHEGRQVPSSGISRWRDLARGAGLDPKFLPNSAIELLDMLSRVLIEGRGWGRNDRMRSLRRDIPFSPSAMSKHGQKRDRRTYQRQCKFLIELGLVLELRRTADGARVIAPAWWEPHYTRDGLSVWREAARRFARGRDCRDDAAVVSQSGSHLPLSCHTPLSNNETVQAKALQDLGVLSTATFEGTVLTVS